MESEISKVLNKLFKQKGALKSIFDYNIIGFQQG